MRTSSWYADLDNDRMNASFIIEQFGGVAMPKARSAKNCYQCEAGDRVRMTFMTCNRCLRYFCSEHGTSQLDQCEVCIESAEETE